MSMRETSPFAVDYQLQLHVYLFPVCLRTFVGGSLVFVGYLLTRKQAFYSSLLLSVSSLFFSGGPWSLTLISALPSQSRALQPALTQIPD